MSKALSVGRIHCAGSCGQLLRRTPITASFTVPLAVGLGVTVTCLARATVAYVRDPETDAEDSVTHGHGSPIVKAQDIAE